MNNKTTMKLSLKFREETHHQNPLLRAKIPVTILGFPFLSGIVAGDSSDLSFSLRSNFSSGPSLSLSYHPTISTSTLPFSLSLKSGIGLFGSPHDSPLIFTANFNLFSKTNPNSNTLTPLFSLQLKPQFGNFSLSKSVKSVNGHLQNGDLANGSVPDFDFKPVAWRDLKMESTRSGILSGIFVAAKTCLPLTKRAVVNFRWGVDFPPESNVQGTKPSLPMLVVNKVSLERVDEVKKVEESKKIEEGKMGDLELLKGMCSLMRREVEDLQRENREMKQALEGVKMQVPGSRGRRGDERKRAVPLSGSDNSSEFERWRSRKGNGNAVGEDNGNEESKKSSKMSEVESELQKAIKSASS